MKNVDHALVVVASEIPLAISFQIIVFIVNHRWNGYSIIVKYNHCHLFYSPKMKQMKIEKKIGRIFFFGI